MSPLQLRIPIEEARPAALAVLAGSLAEPLALEDLLARALDGAVDGVGAEAAAILFAGPQSVGAARVVLRGRSPERRQALQRLHDEGGLADAILASGEPLALADLPHDPRLHGGLRASVGATDLRAYAGVPLLTRSGARGVLAVAGCGPSFAAADLEFLATLAHLVGLVVDNAALSQASDRWRAAAGALAQLARGAAGEAGVARILEVAAEQALAVVGGEACGVFIPGKDAGHLVLACGVGLEGRPGAGEPIPLGRGVVGRAVASRAPAASGDGIQPADGLEAAFPAALAVPLMVRGEPFGALALYRAGPEPFPEVDAGLLALVAVHAGIALESAQLHAETVRKREEAEALQDLTRLISSTLDPDEIFRVLVQRTCHVLGVSRCALWEARQDGEELVLRLRQSVGLDPRAWGAVRLRVGEGTTGGCIARRAPVWTADILRDPAIPLSEAARRRVAAEGYRAVCSAPILRSEGPFGVLTVYRDEPHAFGEREVALLSAFAAQAAIAIENARLYGEAERRRREAEVLAEVAREVNASLTLAGVLRRVAEGAQELCGSDMAGIGLWDHGSEAMVFRHRVGARCQAYDALRIRLGRGAGGRVLVSGRPFRTDHYLEDPQVNQEDLEAVREEGIVAEMVVPIWIGERIEGLLYVDNRTARPFTDRDEAFLRRLADSAGIAIENARLYSQTREALEELEAIHRASQAIAQSLDLDETLKHILVMAMRLTEADKGTIHLLDEERQELVATSVVGLTVDQVMRVPLAEPSLAAACLREGRVTVSESPETDPRCNPTLQARYRNKALVAVPLRSGDRIIGVLDVGDRKRPRHFGAREIAVLERLAQQAVLAIENARLYQEERGRSRDLQALIRASRAVTSSLDLGQILGTIQTSAVELTGGSLATLLLAEAEGPLAWQVCADALPPELARAAASGALAVGKALAEEVASRGQSLWIPDITADPREVQGERLARHGVRSYLGVPILGAGRVLGALSVLGPADGALMAARRELLESLAAQAALAIENARLYAQTREAFDELAVIHEASQAIAQSLDLQETLHRILAAAMRLTDTDKGVIRLLDEERGELVESCALGVLPGPEPRLPLAEPSLAAACLREGQVLISESPATDPRCNSALQARYGNKALIAVPLRSGSRIIGVLDIGDLKRSRRFGAREVAILERLAQQAVVAIENARLFGQVLRSKSEWENTFDSMSDMVAVLDLEGRILRANRALLRRLGLPPGQVLRRSCGDVFGDHGAAWGGCPHRRALDAPAPVALEVEDERLHGSYAVSVFPVRDANGQVIGTVHIARDTTEQKAIQAKLFQADKLASMGTLAAGVAHSINNVLAAIVARADLLLASASDLGLRRSAEVIQQAAMDGAETVRRLQEFAKIKPAPAVTQVDVNQAAGDALEFTRVRWRDEAQARGAPIVVETRLDASARIEGNAAEIREVLINLILNAVDAMPAGGSLRIATADRPGRPAVAAAGRGSPLPPGIVEVRVEDTGIGMSEAVRRRIFDPFFTTKGVTGTGLGLSVSYGLVTKYHGEITVRSREGEGTTFILAFPAAGSSGGAALAPDPAPEPRLGRVLLIEDEDPLREAMAEVLTMAGHRVEAVAGGRQGIERFRPGAFDVVLTDLGMPEVSGLDVARSVKAADPTVYVIVCTGWGNVPGAEDPLRERGVDAVLPKPFRIAEVVRAVRAGLEARAASSPA